VAAPLPASAPSLVRLPAKTMSNSTSNSSTEQAGGLDGPIHSHP
jgi:hypothetical protein